MRHFRRSGVTLLSAIFSLLVLVSALTIVLQTYVVGSRSQRLSAQRDAATVALEAQLETLRAGGYSRLPATGALPIPATALRSLPQAEGRVAVAPGPVPDTRVVTAEVTWEQHGRHREELSIVMAAKGLNP